MNRLLYALLCCWLLVACQSDDIEQPLSDKISSIEINTVEGYGKSATELTYIFEYDPAGRLKKINDKLFYYGDNGRVEFSRIAREVKDENRQEEYIERLSYHWDAQGRLSEVYMDSLYQRYTSFSDEDVLDSDQVSMTGDVLLAKFNYEETNRKPSSIRYRKIDRVPQSPLATLGMEEEVRYSYDGANVVSSQRIGYLDLPAFSTEKLSYMPQSPFKWNSAYTYLTNPNHLTKIYTQLGFHPYNLHEVVNANSIATSKRELDAEELEDIKDRWTPSEGGHIDEGIFDMAGYGKLTYSYHFNMLELPTEIVAEGDGTMQRTIITYE